MGLLQIILMHDDDDNDDPSNLGSKSWQEEHSIISATLTESIESSSYCQLLRSPREGKRKSLDIFRTSFKKGFSGALKKNLGGQQKRYSPLLCLISLKKRKSPKDFCHL